MRCGALDAPLCYAFVDTKLRMTTKCNSRNGINQAAFSVVRQATGEVGPAKLTKAQKDGKKGGSSRAKK